MQFDIKYPYITIRILLIFLTILSTSLIVLLPFSFISFNYFYHYLIPIPSIKLPFSNYILNYDFKSLPPFIIIGKELEPIYGNTPNPNEAYPLDQFQFDLNYNFQLNFKPYCQNTQNDYEPLMYKITIVTDHLINQLSPYGTKPYIEKRFYTWPITNNIHQLHNPHVLVSSMNSMILNCKESPMPKVTKFESFLPPFLKWIIPPIISNLEFHKDDDHYKVDLLKDVNFQKYAINNQRESFFQSGKFNIILEFNKPGIIIDPSQSEIVISSAWKGIRYYLYHYRSLSYAIGTFILWATSTGVLLVTIGGLILIRELRNEAQEVVDQEETEMIDDDELIGLETSKFKVQYPLNLQKGKEGEFYGRDEDNEIDFRVDVQETETTDVPVDESSQITSETTSTT